jgi:hypothetical protein
MANNKNVAEIHGCIVCAKLFNILAVYDPNGKLVNFAVTSPGGHRVPDKQHPLVACDTHSSAEIDSAYRKWENINNLEDEEDGE